MSKTRREYSGEFKLETVMEGIRGEKPVAQICRERGIRDSLYYKWRDLFKEHAAEVFSRQDQQEQTVKELEARVAELERLAGKLALENDILKKVTQWREGQSRRNGR
jgi:transposase-like protein